MPAECDTGDYRRGIKVKIYRNVEKVEGSYSLGGRYKGLNEIRGMACLFVLFSHLSYITWPKFYLGILGHYGVMLFFYLSGFLAYVNHTESGDHRIFTYMKSKIRKFYALYDSDI